MNWGEVAWFWGQLLVLAVAAGILVLLMLWGGWIAFGVLMAVTVVLLSWIMGREPHEH